MKHVSSKVQKLDIVVYLVGGNYVLARMLLQMLACAKASNASINSYVFEEDEIHLWHHRQDGSPVTINT